jgi:hypothetical protein
MPVHGVRAGQEITESRRTYRHHDRQADRRPERIAAADPVPEAEDAVFGDAEGRHLVERRRNGSEVRADGVLPERVGNPVARRAGIRHRLDGGEGLRRDDEESGRRIENLQRVGDVGAVHIGDEMCARAVMERRQRLGGHRRPEIGTADADIHHVGDRLAGRTAQSAAANGIGKTFHRAEHAADIPHHVAAVDLHRPVRQIA